ncbi:Pseudouridine-5'-phosphate glycosidase [Tritonibacter multivorans]|uniref:Pseudouridine-5'-phosphate glycosidase n=1 Tax=Tritonibacter multivorans TaxID=928856 RepID=A0A0P1GJE8_9RHOB|nr:pseudouridine-5'-phosphate glycosidase [Tritonibacter multivorans]MDA7421517.1 pseudouridine-5'-phosphate glycosidase [Tritonibacter multivorans]CUH82258.1 Pseudouridine-5'-phosphate glycosidase [Tritonibacter multivorans]SFC97119.1 pseudouridine-5'-phosphate glycosidase [Tritonibacter multivorans]
MIKIQYSAEVEAARAAGGAIVALESTIITHGMPFPQNVEVAAQVEQDVRDAGATPATMVVIDGVLHVGLEADTLQSLGQMTNVAKLSRADFAACIATGGTGATTVAATMIAARLAGISVFATGGIGGVHKGAEDSFDISADLMELAQTPVTVVAAGAKAILDVPKTLEVLETQGVPVIGYGQDSFPAFWSATSDLAAPLRMDSAADIARAHKMRVSLDLPGGQLVANPIPADAEIPADELAPIIAQAQSEADAQGVSGKGVTPFLLQRIFELTEGRSLVANIALVRNNARLASKIAQELLKI